MRKTLLSTNNIIYVITIRIIFLILYFLLVKHSNNV